MNTSLPHRGVNNSRLHISYLSFRSSSQRSGQFQSFHTYRVPSSVPSYSVNIKRRRMWSAVKK